MHTCLQGVGRKISKEEPTKKRPKNSTIMPPPREGEATEKKTEK